MARNIGNSPLHDAIEELKENGATDEIVQKIEKEALKPANQSHANMRGETGLGALWNVYQKLQHTSKSDARQIGNILAKIGENRVRAEIANQEAAKATPMSTFEVMKAKLSYSQAEKNKMLFESIKNNDQVGLQNAHKIGANFEAREERTGDTPIIYAARLGRMNAILALTDPGLKVNLDAKNYNGETALHVVLPGEWQENGMGRANNITELLAWSGMDINAKDNHGRTPIMTAESFEDADAMKKAGAQYDHEELTSHWRDEGKEDMARAFDAEYSSKYRAQGGYKSEERLREEAAYLSQDQGEDEHEQQGQSA